MEDAPTEATGFWRNPYVWAVVIGCISLTLIRPLLRHVPDPPPVLFQLQPFELIDADGKAFGSDDLLGSVWVGGFVFTRCTSICPMLMQSMASLDRRFEETGVKGVRLVGISVDPEHDTPERMLEYGRRHGVDPARWTLLTGDTDTVRRLVVDGFKTALGEPVPAGGAAIDIAHSGKLVLVDDRGRVRGYYDATPLGLDEVYHRSQHVVLEARREGRLGG